MARDWSGEQVGGSLVVKAIAAGEFDCRCKCGSLFSARASKLSQYRNQGIKLMCKLCMNEHSANRRANMSRAGFATSRRRADMIIPYGKSGKSL